MTTLQILLIILIPLLGLLAICILAVTVVWPQRERAAGGDEVTFKQKEQELQRRQTELDEMEDRYGRALAWLMQQLGLDNSATSPPTEIDISFERRQDNDDEVAEHLHLQANGQLERETWTTAGIDCQRQQHDPRQLGADATARLHGIIGRLVNDGLRQSSAQDSAEDGSLSLSVTLRLGAWALVSRTDGHDVTNLSPRWQELVRELESLLQ